MDDKFVNGTMLSDFAKKLKSNIKSDLLGDKKLRYLTQAEYDLLTDDEKNNENIIYNIIDADIEENGFSGDYNDLTNKPIIPSIDGLATEQYIDNIINERTISINNELIDALDLNRSANLVSYPCYELNMKDANRKTDFGERSFNIDYNTEFGSHYELILKNLTDGYTYRRCYEYSPENATSNNFVRLVLENVTINGVVTKVQVLYNRDKQYDDAGNLNEAVGKSSVYLAVLKSAVNEENMAYFDDMQLTIRTYNPRFLELDNTTEFIPTGDYNPATKKYVDNQNNEIEKLLNDGKANAASSIQSMLLSKGIGGDNPYLIGNYIKSATYKNGTVGNTILRYINFGVNLSGINSGDYYKISFNNRSIPEKTEIIQCYDSTENGSYFINKTLNVSINETSSVIKVRLIKDKQVDANGSEIDAIGKCYIQLMLAGASATEENIAVFDETLFGLEFYTPNFLPRNNMLEYAPTEDYHPATKKYVDSHQAILDFPGVDASYAGVNKGIFIDVENLQVNTFYKMPSGIQRILFRKNGTGNFEVRSGPYALASIFYVQANNDTNTIILEQGPVLVRNNINWENSTITSQVINVNLEYTPTNDYNPATKKYVDDSINTTSIVRPYEIFRVEETIFGKTGYIDVETMEPSVKYGLTEEYLDCNTFGFVIPTATTPYAIVCLSASFQVSDLMVTEKWEGDPSKGEEGLYIIVKGLNEDYKINIRHKESKDGVTIETIRNTRYLHINNTKEFIPTGDYQPATKKYVDDTINENGFSGDYNDLENRPCYMIDDIPDVMGGMYRLPFSIGRIPEEDWYFFPTVSNPENPNVDISYRDMVRVSYTVPDLSLFENIEVYHDDHGDPKSGKCIASLDEYYTLEKYMYVENVYLFNDTKANPNTGLITKYLPCAMIVLEETIISGKDYDDTNISTTFPPGIYLHCGSDTGAKMGTITGVGVKKLYEEMIPSSFAKKDEVVMRNDVVHEGIYKVSEQYDDFRYISDPPSMSTMIKFIDYKTENSGPSIQMISQEAYDALGNNIDPGTLYIIG